METAVMKKSKKTYHCIALPEDVVNAFKYFASVENSRSRGKKEIKFAHFVREGAEAILEDLQAEYGDYIVPQPEKRKKQPKQPLPDRHSAENLPEHQSVENIDFSKVTPMTPEFLIRSKTETKPPEQSQPQPTESHPAQQIHKPNEQRRRPAYSFPPGYNRWEPKTEPESTEHTNRKPVTQENLQLHVTPREHDYSTQDSTLALGPIIPVAENAQANKQQSALPNEQILSESNQHLGRPKPMPTGGVMRKNKMGSVGSVGRYR